MSGLGIKPHFKVQTAETDAGCFNRKRKFFYFCTDTISSIFGQNVCSGAAGFLFLVVIQTLRWIIESSWSSLIKKLFQSFIEALGVCNISKFLTQASSLLESVWGGRNVALNAHWCSHELLKRTENSLQLGEEFFSSVLINRHRPRFQTHLRRHTN